MRRAAEAIRADSVTAVEPAAFRPVVRLALGDGGEVAVDSGASSSSGAAGKRRSIGRGAYLHAELPCIAAAAAKGLARAIRAAASMNGEPLTKERLGAAIASAYERRAQSLLGASKRAGRLEVGTEAVAMAERNGVAHLIILAADASAAADRTEVRTAVSEGRALVWGNKLQLAELVFGSSHGSARSEQPGAGLGVVAVTDTRLANALRESRMIVESVTTPSGAERVSAQQRRSPRKPAVRGPEPQSGVAQANATRQPHDASILAGGTASNLRGPGDHSKRPGSLGRGRNGPPRRGVKSA